MKRRSKAVCALTEAGHASSDRIHPNWDPFQIQETVPAAAVVVAAACPVVVRTHAPAYDGDGIAENAPIAHPPPPLPLPLTLTLPGERQIHPPLELQMGGVICHPGRP